MGAANTAKDTREKLRLASVALSVMDISDVYREALEGLKSLVLERIVDQTWFLIMSKLEEGGVIQPRQAPAEWLAGQTLRDVIGPGPAIDMVLYAQSAAPEHDFDPKLETFRTDLERRLLKSADFLGYREDATILDIVPAHGGGHTLRFLAP